MQTHGEMVVKGMITKVSIASAACYAMTDPVGGRLHTHHARLHSRCPAGRESRP